MPYLSYCIHIQLPYRLLMVDSDLTLCDIYLKQRQQLNHKPIVY